MRDSLDKDKILEITRSNGQFSVHKYAYSHDKVRSKVKNLVRDGYLVRTHHTREESFYKILADPTLPERRQFKKCCGKEPKQLGADNGWLIYCSVCDNAVDLPSMFGASSRKKRVKHWNEHMEELNAVQASE